MSELEPDLSSVTIYPSGSDAQPGVRNLLVFVAAGARVRVTRGGVLLADSRSALLVRELSHSRVYYFPRDDVRLDAFTSVDQTSHCPRKGDASYFTFGDESGPVIAWSYETPIPQAMPICNYVAFYEDQIDLDIED